MSIDQDVRSGLAAELDALAPGAGLVAALERLSPATLTGEDLASYVRACARAQSQAAAGRFVIRTRAGVHHTTLPTRILEPLPPPRPSVRPRPLPEEGWTEEEPGWRQRFLRRTGTLTTTDRPATPPVMHAADEPPPF